jgi:hypothetical protein
VNGVPMGVWISVMFDVLRSVARHLVEGREDHADDVRLRLAGQAGARHPPAGLKRQRPLSISAHSLIEAELMQ